MRTDEAVTPPTWLRQTWCWGYSDHGPRWFVDKGPDSAVLVASGMKEAGADALVVVIQGEDGPSWETEYGGRPDYLGDWDLVGKLSAACRVQDMHFVGYILALNDQPAWKQHKNWRMLNSEYHEDLPEGRQLVCCNSPYRDLVRDRLVELARKYLDLHGVYFDGFFWNSVACYCDNCRDQFKAQNNRQEPPAKETFDNFGVVDPLWQRWQEFQHRSIEESLRDWRQAVREVRQDFVILANTTNGWIFHASRELGGWGGSSVRVADNVDGTVEEEGWYWGGGPPDHSAVSESFFGFPQRWPFMNLYLRSIGNNAAGPGRCVAHMWEAGAVPPAGFYVPLPTSEVIARVADMISFGVHPWPYFHRGPQEMKRVFDFIKGREPWLNDARLVPWCGLVVSANTQYWYGKDDPIPRYMQGIHGALRALWEQHLPVEIVTDEDLERRDLKAYSVLLLDNTACLSKTAAQRIREYVQTGGGLVATYESSLYDEGGQKRPDFELHNLFGANFVSAAKEPSATAPSFLHAIPNQAVLTPETVRLLQANVDDFIDGKPADFTGETTGGMPFPARSLVTRAADPACMALTLSCCDEQGNPVSVSPPPPGLVAVAGNAGQGKVVYAAADLGKSAFFCNLEYVDHVLADALRWAAREKQPVVEVIAPRTVLSVPQQQDTRLVVHLLNDYSSFGRSSVVKNQSIALRHEVLPVRNLLVTFRDTSWKRFALEPGGHPLASEQTPFGTKVTVPEIADWHGMVVAEP